MSFQHCGPDAGGHGERRHQPPNQGEPTGALPNLTIDITGRQRTGEHWHGGTYWDDQEYLVTFAFMAGTRLVTTTLVCESAGDTPLTMLHLSPGDQAQLLRHLDADTRAGLGFAPDLTHTYTWQLGNPDHNVAVTDEDLEQVAAWLRCATSELTYDGDPDKFWPN